LKPSHLTYIVDAGTKDSHSEPGSCFEQMHNVVLQSNCTCK